MIFGVESKAEEPDRETTVPFYFCDLSVSVIVKLISFLVGLKFLVFTTAMD